MTYFGMIQISFSTLNYKFESILKGKNLISVTLQITLNVQNVLPPAEVPHLNENLPSNQ